MCLKDFFFFFFLLVDHLLPFYYLFICFCLEYSWQNKFVSLLSIFCCRKAVCVTAHGLLLPPEAHFRGMWKDYILQWVCELLYLPHHGFPVVTDLSFAKCHRLIHNPWITECPLPHGNLCSRKQSLFNGRKHLLSIYSVCIRPWRSHTYSLTSSTGGTQSLPPGDWRTIYFDHVKNQVFAARRQPLWVYHLQFPFKPWTPGFLECPTPSPARRAAAPPPRGSPAFLFNKAGPAPPALPPSRRQLVVPVTSEVPAARRGGAARRPQDGGPDPSAPGAAQRPAQSGLLQQRLRGAEAQQVRARAAWAYPHPAAPHLLSSGEALGVPSPSPAVLWRPPARSLTAGGDPA